MEEKLFNELVESVKEMGAYLRGEIEIEPSRIRFVSEPDPREIQAEARTEAPDSQPDATARTAAEPRDPA